MKEQVEIKSEEYKKQRNKNNQMGEKQKENNIMKRSY